MRLHIEHSRYDTPLGPVLIAATQRGIASLRFVERSVLDARRGEPPHGVRDALVAYFDGDLSALDALKLDITGTPFQRRVWGAVRDIEAGRTASYAEIARAIGARPGAARAVGAANGANPVLLIVPCHRVVGAAGALTGYAAGIERKRSLLEHEGALGPRTLDLFGASEP